MKILHTADLHLREYGSERWEALQELIEIGRAEKISIFVISGDLFDKGIDAQTLKPRIRKIFSGNGFKILIIPGNHDKDSYKSGMYFGEDAIILNDSSPFEYENARVIGMPFEPIEGEAILSKIRSLKGQLSDKKKNILLCHGELLDAFFSRKDFGDEGEGRYMPFKLSYFKDLNIDYILAGHFHTNFDIKQLENGRYFVYPGSPISITKKETGQRKVNIFEVGKAPREHPLDTFHYEEVDIKLDPLGSEQPLEIAKSRFAGLHPKARAILTIGGYINSKRIKMGETELISRVKEITKGRCEDEHYNFRDIQTILEDDLFKMFLKELEKKSLPEEKIKAICEIAIRAMMEAKP